MARFGRTVRDSQGNAISGATVKVYLAGTLTFAAIFSDAALTASIDQATSPLLNEDDGTYEFFLATGTYKVVVSHPTLPSETYDNVDIGFSAALVIDVRTYGAIGNGVADDTVAVQAALVAALAARATLYFPSGTYLLSGSGSEILKVTKAIPIAGDGKYSVLKFAAGVPNTRDMILYEPATTSDGIFFSVRDLQFATTSGAGRYGVHIRPAAAGISASRFLLERLWIQSIADFGVFLDGNLATASGIFTATIRDLQIRDKGIGGVDVLDSMVIENCVLAGAGYGIDLTFGSGPGKFSLLRSNVTATGGIRLQGNMAGALIADNYFETIGTYVGAGGAMVDLDGGAGTLTKPVVRDNQFTVLSGIGSPNALRLGKVFRATVAGNQFSLQDAASAGIEVEATSTNPWISSDNRFSTVGTPVINGSGADISDRVGNILDSHQSDVTTVGTTKETVYTLTLYGNTLDEVGRTIRVTASGTQAANGNSKIIRTELGASVLHGWSTTTSGASWRAVTTIQKTGANAQRVVGSREISGVTTAVSIADFTLTDTGTLDLKVTIETPTAPGDATLKSVIVEILN